jgi:integrase
MLELRNIVLERHWRPANGVETSGPLSLEVVRLLGESLPPRMVDPVRIDGLIVALRGKGNAAGTINRKLAALSKMLHYAYEREWLVRVPKIAYLPNPPGRIRWYTADEESRFVAEFLRKGSQDMADITLFLIDTGIRLGEACRIPWTDVADGWCRLWETKGRKPYSVPATPRLTAMLHRRRDGRPDSRGPFDGWRGDRVDAWWRRAKGRLGMADDSQAVPHACRHTFASRLVQAGVDIRRVQELMGHASIEMTLRYAHLAPQNLVSAMEVMRLHHGLS